MSNENEMIDDPECLIVNDTAFELQKVEIFDDGIHSDLFAAKPSAWLVNAIFNDTVVLRRVVLQSPPHYEFRNHAHLEVWCRPDDVTSGKWKLCRPGDWIVYLGTTKFGKPIYDIRKKLE